jgi:hypothetical protein
MSSALTSVSPTFAITVVSAAESITGRMIRAIEMVRSFLAVMVWNSNVLVDASKMK